MAIVATLTAVNLVMVCTLPPFERRAKHLSQAWGPILAAMVVALLEIWMAGLLRSGLVALVERLGG